MAQYFPRPATVEDQLPYAVIHNGMLLNCLNPALINRNGLSTKEVEHLKRLHCELYEVYLKMEATDDKTELRDLAKEVTRIEFEQQKNWRFFQDEKKHRWFDVPKCRCPKVDNEERLGTPFKIISADCPIHSNG